MKILILHGNEDIEKSRRTSVNHGFFLIKYAPQHQYTLQYLWQPVTERLRKEKFDAIIIDTLFLCWRWARPREVYWKPIFKEYSFVADSDAVKIAFPQDEYDHSELLDELLSRWKVDVIYSVCYDHREVFYPKSLATAEIKPGFTGLVDDADIQLVSSLARPFAAREVDVGYRARDLPPHFGSFGRMKAEIGKAFVEAMGRKPLKLDISIDLKDVFHGDDWLRFLGNCRFTLGSESGSSILDGRGEIRAHCEAFLSLHPMASFAEIERACFRGEDRKWIFSAVSPRLFEAAIARTCQILVPGRYLGILKPDEHYIPLEADLSNAEEVFRQMQDRRAVLRRIEACYETLVRNNQFSYRCHAGEILKVIARHLEKKGRSSVRDGMKIGTAVDGLERHYFVMIALKVAENHAQDLKKLYGVKVAVRTRLVFFIYGLVRKFRQMVFLSIVAHGDGKVKARFRASIGLVRSIATRLRQITVFLAIVSYGCVQGTLFF